jgi:hypothetical protein
VAQFLQIQADLRAALFRFDCPSAHTLGEYLLDLLDPAERTRVAAHATDCEHCLAELQTLRTYLAAPMPSSESLLNQVRRRVASLFTPAPGLAYGGLRGTASATTRIFSVDDITITVGPGPATGSLVGLLIVDDRVPETLAGVTARLVPTDGWPITVIVDSLGNFEFTEVSPGAYTLEIDLPDSLIVVEALRVD